MDRKSEKHMQELYAAWGTTRDEHMARMLDLVARLNARVADADEDDGRLLFSNRTVIKNRAKAKRFADARFLIKKSFVNRPVIEIGGKWLEVVRNEKGEPMIVKTEDGRFIKLRKGSGKPVRDAKTKSTKDRKRKK